MDAAFQEEVRPKLDVLDRIRPYVQNQNLELPGIVVVGDQSSGKSSLLETISAVSLPHGDDMVTRCPLQLSLRPGEEHASIKYTDSADNPVNKEIPLEGTSAAVVEATEAICGTDKSINNKLIVLEVTRPQAPMLTLIDLPGIIRVPKRNQPEAIVDQIKDLIKTHAKGDSKVILCMLPATNDMATHESLTIARELDPEQRRTVGVITKIDVHSDGLRRKLEPVGDDIKLELGFVAVRLRGRHEDISLEELQDKERQFFADSPELQEVHEDSKGMAALIHKLIRLQVERIQEYVPQLKVQLQDRISAAQDRIDKAGNVVVTATDAENELIRCLAGLDGMFKDLISARYTRHVEQDMKLAPRMDELGTEFVKQLWEHVGGRGYCLGAECREELRNLTREMAGVGLPDSHFDPAVEEMYRRVMYEKLECPCLGHLDAAHKLVEKVLIYLIHLSFREHRHLRHRVLSQVEQLLREALNSARAFVRGLIDNQGILYTNNHYYSDTKRKMLARLDQGAEQDHGGAPPRKKQKMQQRSETAHVNSSHTATPPHNGHMANGHGPDGGVSSEGDTEEDEDVLEAWQEGLEANVSNEAQTLLSSQIRLYSYCKVVGKIVTDEVHKTARVQLMNKVSDQLQARINVGVRRNNTNLLDLMKDAHKARRLQQDRNDLSSLTKALDEMNTI